MDTINTLLLITAVMILNRQLIWMRLWSLLVLSTI